ncbi:MAG TPA: hypothetical protein PLV59_02175 [Candidatus Dojkabacteria bacterium]|nr:hypothetical protein [Candidatus Dojkabacteria bacterium]
MGTGLSLITEYALGGLIFWSTLVVGFFLSSIFPAELLTNLSPILTGLVLIGSPFVYLTGLLIDILGNEVLQLIKIERNLGSDNYNKIVVNGSNSAKDRVRGFESTKRFLRISFISFLINVVIFLITGCITNQPLLFCFTIIALFIGILSFTGYLMIKQKYEAVLEQLS